MMDKRKKGKKEYVRQTRWVRYEDVEDNLLTLFIAMLIKFLIGILMSFTGEDEVYYVEKEVSE